METEGSVGEGRNEGNAAKDNDNLQLSVKYVLVLSVTQVAGLSWVRSTTLWCE